MSNDKPRGKFIGGSTKYSVYYEDTSRFLSIADGVSFYGVDVNRLGDSLFLEDEGEGEKNEDR